MHTSPHSLYSLHVVLLTSSALCLCESCKYMNVHMACSLLLIVFERCLLHCRHSDFGVSSALPFTPPMQAYLPSAACLVPRLSSPMQPENEATFCTSTSWLKMYHKMYVRSGSNIHDYNVGLVQARPKYRKIVCLLISLLSSLNNTCKCTRNN